MEKDAAIYVAGGGTMAGGAIRRLLERTGFTQVYTGTEPDLNDVAAVDAFFNAARPDYVFHAAGASGGIQANQERPAQLMLDNLRVTCHVLDAAYRHGCRKLLYLASSCTYPRDCPQPMSEDSLLTGPPEPTNEFYAVAKLAGLKLCQAYRRQYGADFVCAIPANPFGVGDDFEPGTSHVIPGLIRRMHQAKKAGAKAVDVWGTGRARRQFLFAADLAAACLFAMDRYSDEQPVNLAGKDDVSIAELAGLIKEAVGFRGELRFDASKPDGMPLKALDGAKLARLGWRPETSLREGIERTYEWYLDTLA